MGLSPPLLLPWGLQDVGWCCIPAVPELIPFLFAELQALAAASQSLEQTARVVEGLGKHAWYFPSFPPPPPPTLPQPSVIFSLGFVVCLAAGRVATLSAFVICFCWRWARVGGPHCTPSNSQSPILLYAGLQSVVSPVPAAPPGMAFTGASQTPFPRCMPCKPSTMPQQGGAPAGHCSSSPWPQSPPQGPSPAAPVGFFSPTGASVPCACASSVPWLHTHITPRVHASLFTWVHTSLAPWVHASWFL